MSHIDYGACVTCEKVYECGVGGYASSMTSYRTLVAFDVELASHGLTPETCSGRARAWRSFLAQHQGHELLRWDSDCARIDDAGDLVLDYDNDLIHEGVGRWAWFYGFDEHGEWKTDASPPR